MNEVVNQSSIVQYIQDVFNGKILIETSMEYEVAYEEKVSHGETSKTNNG